MTVVTVHKAKTHLSELMARAEAGEEVVIARGAKPVVRLTPIERPEPPRAVFGRYKGQFEVTDAFFEPYTDEEMGLTGADKPW